MKNRPIGLQGQQVIAATRNDLFRNVGLGPHGIDGDQRAGQFQPFQQKRNSDDLIGLFIDRLLTKDKALTGCPGGDQMQRLAAPAPPMGPPRCLAINGNDVGRMLVQGFDPVGKAGLEQLRVEPVDHVIERVVGRDAALVGQETSQKIKPLFAPQLDFHEILHARQRGAKHKQ